ncbi:MAG: phosphoenolpyruvate carboxykinase (ATP) [Segetibacter sp.]
MKGIPMMLKEKKLFSIDLCAVSNIHYQLPPQELIQQTLDLKQGELNNTGALVIRTGEFTRRSPENRFFVKDYCTEKNVDWNKFNIPIEEKYFLQLKKELLEYLGNKEVVWIRDCYACAHPDYRLNIRVINETPWSNLFAHNLFLRPAENESILLNIDWQIIQAAGFKANPDKNGTRNENFTIISFAHKTIDIEGTGYTGEIKKAIFTVLNYILP